MGGGGERGREGGGGGGGVLAKVEMGATAVPHSYGCSRTPCTRANTVIGPLPLTGRDGCSPVCWAGWCTPRYQPCQPALSVSLVSPSGICLPSCHHPSYLTQVLLHTQQVTSCHCHILSVNEIIFFGISFLVTVSHIHRDWRIVFVVKPNFSLVCFSLSKPIPEHHNTKQNKAFCATRSLSLFQHVNRI